MESGKSGVPKEILDRLGTLLEVDGFRQTIPALFVRNLDQDWRAWIVVTGFPFALFPTAGVYNEALVQLARTARARLGRNTRQKPDSGPPLIMVSLDHLIEDDPDCLKRASWDLEVNDQHISNPSLVPELSANVADDLVFCYRKKAYPFFAGHMTFESILDAARARMGSPALPNYLPLILMKLGRHDDAMKYVRQQVQKIPDEKMAADFNDYAQELLKLVPA